MTLKQFTTLLLSFILAFSAEAQNYNNIEFIENKGQWDPRVKFKGNVSAGALFIRSSGFTVLQYNQQDLDKLRTLIHGHADTVSNMANKGIDKDETVTLRGHAYDVDFVGAAPEITIMPDKIIPTYNNYFTGDDPSKWAGECHIYQAITLSNVYPGIDVRYYTYNGTLKYDIVARPGADISKIALKYKGADKLEVKNKELVVSTSVGDLRESYPYSYQSDGKERKEVSCKYSIKDNIVRFDIKNYDRNSTLVIDPSMVFCSFSGSLTDNWGFTATYGPDGSMFGGGIAFDNGFPVTTGSFQTTFAGGDASHHPGPVDIAIIKLSSNGANRVYATYIGGSGNEQPHSLIVNSAGNLIVAGRTNSPLTGSGAYPLVGGAAGLEGPCGGYDIIVTELNAAGSALVGSKRIGGTGSDGVNISDQNSATLSLDRNYGDGSRSEVILDAAGNIYVASCTQTNSSNATDKFPVTPGAFQQNFGGGTQDGVVLKFNPTLSTRLFSSFLGGDQNDAAYVLSVAPSGDIYVAGGTESSGATFPGNHAGTIGTNNHGIIDGFVAQISNNGTSIIRSTFIGTAGIDQIYGIQFDRSGFPYIMGQTTGNWDAVVVNAPYNVPGSKQFICKLQPDLSAFVYATNFGTPSSIPNISPTAFLVDRCENVYVSGWGGRVAPGYSNAGTSGMYVSPDAYKATSPDNSDFYFFVLRKNAATPPLYGSFFGQDGGFTDHVDGGTSRFDANGVIYQAICANCGGGVKFPTTIGSAYPNHNASVAFCNLAMVKMSFNLAGVGAQVQSAIGGVPKDTAGCLPLQVVFTDQIRNAIQYIWNFGDGGADVGPLSAGAPDNGYTQTHTYNNVGTYTVMLVAIDPNSCNVRDTSYVHIRVGDLKANLAASYEKLDPCQQFNYRFHNLSTTDVSRPFTNISFEWNFGDGSPRVPAGISDVDHTYPAPGTYHAFLVLNDTAYCNDPDSIPIDVRVSANVVAKITTPPVGCAPYDADFFNNSDGGISFEWNFGDPASGANNTATTINGNHTYINPGTYTIVLVANDPNTCNKTDTTRTTIVVYDKPTAAFTYTPVTPVENTPDIFTNQSSANATRFKWDFGDGDTLLTNSRGTIQHQYNATGNFNACLIAFNDAGCSDTACQPVSTIIVPVLDVPNAFTPNSGNVNSKVFVRGFGIAKMHFIIWNRWGQKVFETNDRFEGWDGKVKGVVQPMDVYAYTLDVEFFDKTKTTRKGDITLLR